MLHVRAEASHWTSWPKAVVVYGLLSMMPQQELLLTKSLYRL